MRCHVKDGLESRGMWLERNRSQRIYPTPSASPLWCTLMLKFSLHVAHTLRLFTPSGSGNRPYYAGLTLDMGFFFFLRTVWSKILLKQLLKGWLCCLIKAQRQKIARNSENLGKRQMSRCVMIVCMYFSVLNVWELNQSMLNISSSSSTK